MANASIVRETAPGQYAGPVADLATRLAGLLGLAVRIVPFASGGAILADPEAWDMAVLAVDPARTQLRYIHEVTRVSATLAGRSDGLPGTCAEADRPGIRIATARGAAYGNHLLAGLVHAEVVSFDTPAAAREAMLSGQCDFVAGIRTTLQDSLAQHPGTRLMPDDFLTVSQALALPTEHTEAAVFFDKILSP
nr:transporter substrate-binding domain-containing protein [Paracoccus limosus]